jgi:ABC-type sugar transport system ATPase subunit
VAILKLINLEKDYPGCRALADVSVSFESGKVNALLGKNGSGKSTLVKCVCSAEKLTKGDILLDGEKLDFSSPKKTSEKGIVVVYQEMSLIPSLTVTENIFLGRLPKKGPVIDWDKAHHDAVKLLELMKVDINPKIKVSALSMWQCQVIEITKAMSFHPRVIMLDEPTSALASNEVNNLFSVIKELKNNRDVIIIYISHKLQEIPRIADTVTVLRDGELIDQRNIEDVDENAIIHMMFGNVKTKSRPNGIVAGGEILMEIKNFSRKGKFENINFALKRGEVLGIAGMLGSGRTELLRSIFGADPFNSGEIVVNGCIVSKNANPIKMKALGLGLTPEDRKLEGVILKHSIRDNLCYASMGKTSHGWIEDHRKRRVFAEKQIVDLQIKVPDIKNSVNSLSGGNQQKVVVGNWLNNEPEIMIFDEPTRGIDVNAKQQIFEIMWTQSQKGISSIFVSTELEELLVVCHRILIMQNGHITGEVKANEVDVKDLYTLCMGGK